MPVVITCHRFSINPISHPVGLWYRSMEYFCMKKYSNNVVQYDPTIRTMMTSSNGTIFRVTGPLCGKFTCHRWIPLTKASDVELWCFLWSAPWINGWVNNRVVGYLRRHRAHCDVIVMQQDNTKTETHHTTHVHTSYSPPRAIDRTSLGNTFDENDLRMSTVRCITNLSLVHDREERRNQCRKSEIFQAVFLYAEYNEIK